MGKKLIVSSLLIALTITVFISIAYADIIHLKDGGIIEGEIIEKTEDTIKVKTTYGIVTLRKNQVTSTEKKLTAEQIYQKKLLKIDPNDTKAHYQLGLFCIKKGLNDYAIKEFKRALRIEPDYLDAHYYLGIAYQKQGNYKKALLEFEKILAQTPVYISQDKDRLFELLQKAKENQNYTKVHSYLGERYEKRGRHREALSEWEKVIDTCLKATKEQRKEARKHLQNLHKIIPPNTNPRKANIWDICLVIVRNTDIEWIDKERQLQRKQATMSDEEIEKIKEEFIEFTKRVFEYSRGNLSINYRIKILDETLDRISKDLRKGTHWVYWASPANLKELKINRLYKSGEIDSVFVYWKQTDIPRLGWGVAGGTLNGARFASFTTPGSWGLFLHEWLHHIDGNMRSLGYPNELVPGPHEGIPSAVVMGEYITSKMWQEATVSPVIVSSTGHKKHPGKYTIDKDPITYWLSHKEDRMPEITIKLQEAFMVDEIRLQQAYFPAWGRRTPQYQRYARAKEIEIKFLEDASSVVTILEDNAREFQVIRFKPKKTQCIRIIIKSTYPGKVYPKDVGFQEIQVYHRGQLLKYSHF